MSQVAPTSLSEGQSVSSLTVLVLLLVPCVVLLLLLNCLFLLCKLLVLSKRRSRRGSSEEMLLRSDVIFSPLSERATTHPVTSSRASSLGAHGIRLLTPDDATRSHRAPSTIRTTTASSCNRITPGLDPFSGLRVNSARLPQSSDSEAEVRLNMVPPNTPKQGADHLIHQSYNMLIDVSPDVAEHQPLQTSCSMTSAVGPGLDSDFGASAGVSLRILSADSDGLSSGVLASVLEWDYYDPCYVQQNNVPKHQNHRPALHTKHYWV
ncbi:unnamed protein product [Ophioblennius macclurei]